MISKKESLAEHVCQGFLFTYQSKLFEYTL